MIDSSSLVKNFRKSRVLYYVCKKRYSVNSWSNKLPSWLQKFQVFRHQAAPATQCNQDPTAGAERINNHLYTPHRYIHPSTQSTATCDRQRHPSSTNSPPPSTVTARSTHLMRITTKMKSPGAHSDRHSNQNYTESKSTKTQTVNNHGDIRKKVRPNVSMLRWPSGMILRIIGTSTAGPSPSRTATSTNALTTCHCRCHHLERRNGPRSCLYSNIPHCKSHIYLC